MKSPFDHDNRGFRRWVTWQENPWRDRKGDRLLMHLGCGSLVIDGLVNIDFLPEHPEVQDWNLLAPWPKALQGNVDGIVSEDVMEHFFYNEQMYILCQANVALRMGGIKRILMPSGERVLQLKDGWKPHENEMFYWLYQAETPMDAINSALRFSGHRWLHDRESLAHLAGKCGFRAEPSSCAASSIKEFCSINHRTEGDALSFATELVKTTNIRRVIVEPSDINNATYIDLMDGNALYHATTNDPSVTYEFPAVSSEDIVLMNFRGANLSQFFEHNFAQVYFKLAEEYSFSLDRTMSSMPYNNIVQGLAMRSRLKAEHTLTSLRFDPGRHAGDYFTVGPLELFIIERK